MKKLLSLLIALLMLVGMMAVPAMAADGDVKVYLFGQKLSFDVPPQIINGRTMVPFRKIFESLGASVDWNQDTRTVSAVSKDKTIVLTIDSLSMYVNGEEVSLDVAPCIVDSRTLVPARAVSEAFDLEVDWISETKTVTIARPVTVNAELDNVVVAKIGDYEITQADYNCVYHSIYTEYAAYSQYFGADWINMDLGDGVTIAEKIKEDTEKQLASLAIAMTFANNLYGITSKDVEDYVKEGMLQIQNSYGDWAEYEELYADMRMSEKALKKYIGMSETFSLLLEKFAADSNYISEAEMKMMFEQDYAGMMNVQHILVATESISGTTPSKTDEEAIAIVNEILKKLEDGEDFGKLIDLYNEDPGMTSKNYYIFGDGEMVKEFEVASKNLAEGEYTTSAVKTAYGYHIIKRYPLYENDQEYKMYKEYKANEKLLAMIEEEILKSPIVWDMP